MKSGCKNYLYNGGMPFHSSLLKMPYDLLAIIVKLFSWMKGFDQKSLNLTYHWLLKMKDRKSNPILVGIIALYKDVVKPPKTQNLYRD